MPTPSTPPTEQPAPSELAGVAIDGRRVRELRKLSGCNGVVFAESCGITHQYLSMIERGTRPTVSPQVFAQIADALGVSDRRDLLVKAAA